MVYKTYRVTCKTCRTSRLVIFIKKNIMGTTAKKPRAMRSKKSGIKTANQIKKNNEILKKIKL
jgi:hypothetical protein